jgi:16S rRNA (uracil1498-N3)-methyltransferase
LPKIGNDIKVRIHRVHTHQHLEPGQEVSIGDRSAHYLIRVLRITAGQTIILFNGDGHDYVADVIRPGKKEIILEVNSRLPAARESGLKITVVQAISRGERMDQTLQKCTELGAQAFQPLFSARVEVRLQPEKLQKRLEHWQAVVVSACEQSGRAIVPEVYRPLDLGEWLYQAEPGPRLVLTPGADQSLADMKIPGCLDLVIGPEGGFSDVELDLMISHSVQPVSLGPRVLRTETAAPAAVAALQVLAGDFA